jgi:uncharacterized DUF497 family protein
MDFEWDSKKAEANEAKHGVSFATASEVFADDFQRRFLIRITRAGKIAS